MGEVKILKELYLPHTHVVRIDISFSNIENVYVPLSMIDEYRAVHWWISSSSIFKAMPEGWSGN